MIYSCVVASHFGEKEEVVQTVSQRPTLHLLRPNAPKTPRDAAGTFTSVTLAACKYLRNIHTNLCEPNELAQ